MKKALFLLLALVCVVSMFSVTAFAAGINENEQAILDKLSQTITVDGKKLTIPASYINSAKNWMASSADIDKTTADEIISYIDDAIALAKKADDVIVVDKKANEWHFDAETNGKILEYAKKCTDAVGLTIQVSGNTVTILDGTKVAFEGDGVVKATGNAADYTVVYVVAGAAMMLVLASAVVSKKAKLLG